MTAKHEQLARFVSDHAVLRGTFQLASGRQSDYYIDGKKILAQPQGLRLVCDAMKCELGEFNVKAIGGLEIGAIYIATAVALDSLNWAEPIPQFTVRKEKKQHGSKKQVEGVIPSGHAVAVVDDVVTTGGSLLQAIDAIRGEGCQVAVAITIVDRCSGARENLEGANVVYRPLLTIAELGLSNDRTGADDLQQAAR